MCVVVMCIHDPNDVLYVAQALQAEVQQLQADKAAALHEVHELKLAAVPVSGEFVSNKPLAVSKPRCGGGVLVH